VLFATLGSACVFMVQQQPTGRHAPVIVCDHCGGLVERAGTVEWLHNHAEQALVEGPFTLHKRCSTPFRASRHGGEASLPDGLLWQWWELDAYLAALVHNARIDLVEGEWRIDLLGNTG
jgi:hypothetical protein